MTATGGKIVYELMPELTKKDEDRLLRYRGQSLRLLQDAMDEVRASRWDRCEELLWGSLTLAVKGVALGQGKELDGLKAVEAYALELGQEHRDRRIRESFTKPIAPVVSVFSPGMSVVTVKPLPRSSTAASVVP